MTTSSDSALESIGKLFVGGLLLVLNLVSRGWAISTLWNWFVAPPFNAPRLTILSAIGLAMAVTLFTFDWRKAIKEAAEDKDKEWGKASQTSFIIAVIGYPFAVFAGWMVHSFL